MAEHTAENDAPPVWGDRWRLNPRPSDRLRALRCLLRGHDWTVNARRSQRVCYLCFALQERVFPPHAMRLHGRISLHSESCWCRKERGSTDRGWVYEHSQECAECRDAARPILPGAATLTEDVDQ